MVSFSVSCAGSMFEFGLGQDCERHARRVDSEPELIASSQAANCVPAGVVRVVSVDIDVEGNNKVKWYMTLVDIRREEQRRLTAM